MYIRLTWWVGDEYATSNVIKTDASIDDVNYVVEKVKELDEYDVETFVNMMLSKGHSVRILKVVDIEDF